MVGGGEILTVVEHQTSLVEPKRHEVGSSRDVQPELPSPSMTIVLRSTPSMCQIGCNVVVPQGLLMIRQIVVLPQAMLTYSQIETQR